MFNHSGVLAEFGSNEKHWKISLSPNYKTEAVHVCRCMRYLTSKALFIIKVVKSPCVSYVKAAASEKKKKCVTSSRSIRSQGQVFCRKIPRTLGSPSLEGSDVNL